jgi:hypothetical protein
MDDPFVSLEIILHITTALRGAQACLRTEAAASCRTPKRNARRVQLFIVDARGQRFYNRATSIRRCMWVFELLHPIIAGTQL